jgi:hypothetical protein
VLDIAVHKNVRLPEVIACDILNSVYLPIIFHLLDDVRTEKLSDPVEKFADWQRLQTLAFELISPRT